MFGECAEIFTLDNPIRLRRIVNEIENSTQISLTPSLKQGFHQWCIIYSKCSTSDKNLTSNTIVFASYQILWTPFELPLLVNLAVFVCGGWRWVHGVFNLRGLLWHLGPKEEWIKLMNSWLNEWMSIELISRSQTGGQGYRKFTMFGVPVYLLLMQ